MLNIMSEEKKNIGLRILDIKELSYSNKISDELIKNFNEDKVDIKLGFGVNGDQKESTISLSIIIHFRYPLSTDSKFKDFLKLETETTFKIFNYTENDIRFEDVNNQIFIDDNLMSIFLSTSIGATRGMLAYKIASLPINLVLPLFDMSQILPPNKNEQKVKKAK